MQQMKMIVDEGGPSGLPFFVGSAGPRLIEDIFASTVE